MAIKKKVKKVAKKKATKRAPEKTAANLFTTLKSKGLRLPHGYEVVVRKAKKNTKKPKN